MVDLGVFALRIAARCRGWMRFLQRFNTPAILMNAMAEKAQREEERKERIAAVRKKQAEAAAEEKKDKAKESVVKSKGYKHSMGSDSNK